MNRRNLFKGGAGLTAGLAAFGLQGKSVTDGPDPRWINRARRHDWMNDALDEIIPDPMEVAARVLYNNAEGDYENAQFYLAEMRSLSPAARRAYLKRRMRKMGALCDALNTILMGKINAKAADSSPEGRPPHPPRTG